jgi:class 3 adenylate cyclase
MATSPTETLVCSVLFLDLTDYSKRPVADQIRLKQLFNAALAQALVQVASRDRIVVDTGDGAALTFPGDPESALLVALAMLDHAEDLPMRMGINLGPVHRLSDLNGNENVIGDGINVAQRIMSFAEPGQLLVSRSYYEVVTRMSREYEKLFSKEDPRKDKHVREHEVYAVSEAVAAGRRVAELQARLKPAVHEAAAKAADVQPASVFDAGTHLVISGTSRAAVERSLQELTAKGHVALTAPAQVGSKWIASCGYPKSDVKVEQMGMQRMVSGSSRSSVQAKVDEIVELGGVVLSEAQCHDGVWTAVCETRS